MRLLALSILLSAMWPAGAGAQAAQSAADSAAAAEIAGLEHRVETAVARGGPADIAFLDSVYATDFRFKHATGQTQDRVQWLALVRGRLARGTVRDVDSLDVELHGDVALSTGRIHVQREPGAPGSRPARYTIRYARVWARRGGRWRLLTHHSTAQLPDSEP